ncbi:MAG: MBL fold metallo-hydrolase, partial [Candidatus Odinarchaeota archaeon]
NSKLLIDPRNKKVGDIDGDIVYATHYHSDHTAGIENFLKRNTVAVLICNEQVKHRFKKWNDRIILAVPGEEVVHGPWKLAFFNFRHGFFRGVQNVGVVVRINGVKFGHPGDAVEFKSFYQEQLDVFATPIGSLFAASPRKAIAELKHFSSPLPVVVPIHWLMRNPGKFCKSLGEQLDCRCIVPENGKVVNWHAVAD